MPLSVIFHNCTAPIRLPLSFKLALPVLSFLVTNWNKLELIIMIVYKHVIIIKSVHETSVGLILSLALRSLHIK